MRARGDDVSRSGPAWLPDAARLPASSGGRAGHCGHVGVFPSRRARDCPNGDRRCSGQSGGCCRANATGTRESQPSTTEGGPDNRPVGFGVCQPGPRAVLLHLFRFDACTGHTPKPTPLCRVVEQVIQSARSLKTRLQGGSNLSNSAEPEPKASVPWGGHAVGIGRFRGHARAPITAPEDSAAGATGSSPAPCGRSLRTWKSAA